MNLRIRVEGLRRGKLAEQTYSFGQWTNLSDAAAQARESATAEGINVARLEVIPA